MTILARTLVIGIATMSIAGCYVYHERDKALIDGLDVNQSLEVARMEMNDNKFATVLAVWALRDQILNVEQAEVVSSLYFKHIDRIDSDEQEAREFSVWHLTWAISNMYRLNGDEVRTALKAVYEDAEKRVASLEKDIASRHFNDDEMLMGDIHGGGRAYARSHLVVPGNDRYLQSVKEYIADRKDD
jgi:hypothetical protein